MVGENSFEGLLFSLAEVGDPNILDSYDWNSGFGVGASLYPKIFLVFQGEHSLL